ALPATFSICHVSNQRRTAKGSLQRLPLLDHRRLLDAVWLLTAISFTGARVAQNQPFEPEAACSCGLFLWCLFAGHAEALFFIAPTIAVSMAPPAPPAIACEIMPLTLKLPD